MNNQNFTCSLFPDPDPRRHRKFERLFIVFGPLDGILWTCMGSTHMVFYKFKENPDDVIKWKHFPRYWPFVWGVHWSPVNSPHKGQWRGALLFSLICARINVWVNNRETGDLRRHRTHYDVTIMSVGFISKLRYSEDFHFVWAAYVLTKRFYKLLFWSVLPLLSLI